MTDRSYRYCSNEPVGFDYANEPPDYGTIEERHTLAHHAIRFDGLEPWKGLLFVVCPEAFHAMVQAHRDRANVLTSSDE